MFRLALDKCFITLFFEDFHYESSIQRLINRDLILKEMRMNYLKFHKFSFESGFLRCDFFESTYKMCFYKPLLQFNHKVISWIVVDLETARGFAYFNVNEVYMLRHNIDPPRIKLNETNYIPEDIEFSFQDKVDQFYECVNFVRREFIALMAKFNVNIYDKGKAIPLKVLITALEVCKEFLNTNVYMVSLNEARHRIRAVFDTENITITFNNHRGSNKHKCKLYEKTHTLLRLEFTLFKLKDILHHRSKERFASYLKSMVDELERVYNLKHMLQHAKAYTTSESFLLWYQTIAGNSYKPISKEEFAWLLSRNHYIFNRSTENLKRKFIRRRLIRLDDTGKRGVYIPTEKLAYIQRVLQSYSQRFFDENPIEAEIIAEENLIKSGVVKY